MIDYTLVIEKHWHSEYRDGDEPDQIWVYVVPVKEIPYDVPVEHVAVARVKFSGQLWRQMFND